MPHIHKIRDQAKVHYADGTVCTEDNRPELTVHDVELHVNGNKNQIDLYTNDWVTHYKVIGSNSRDIRLQKLSREKCFR